MTEQQKQTRRARRNQERGAEGVPASPDEGSKEPKQSREAANGSEQIKDRNQRLRNEAARKRAQRKRGRTVAATEGLDAGERVDDALTRSAHAATKFIQKNISWMQWVVVLGAAGSIGYLIYDYRAQLGREKATDALMAAVSAQQGRLAGQNEWRTPDTNLVDPRDEFASAEERLKAAESRYRAALADVSQPGTRLFAQLGLAGTLYDQGRYAEARAAYEETRSHPLVSDVPDVLGRAVEGIALSFEAEGKPEEALKKFAELEDVTGQGNLARYHQARLWHARGESEKALETLSKVREKLVDGVPGQRPGFLQASVEELMRSIDPEAVPAPGAEGITPEQLRELQKQIEEMQRMQQQMPMDLPQESPEAQVPADPTTLDAPTSPETPAANEPQPAPPAAAQPPSAAPEKPAAPRPAPPPAKSPAAPQGRAPAPTAPVETAEPSPPPATTAQPVQSAAPAAPEAAPPSPAPPASPPPESSP